ncbi:MAG TPA: hypothetical protein VGW78_02410, partial [Candidatus Babeliales bacterium]|nr:hypothetical protein [Candidatus Babeliales bacterium]
ALNAALKLFFFFIKLDPFFGFRLPKFLFHFISNFGPKFCLRNGVHYKESEKLQNSTEPNDNQKLPLKYVADNQPNCTPNIVKEYLKDIEVSPETLLSVKDMENAKKIINTIAAKEADYNDQKFILYGKTFLHRCAFIGSIIIGKGLSLIGDALSLIWPCSFGRPQCTIKC